MRQEIEIVLSSAVYLKRSEYLAWRFKCVAFRNWDLAYCLQVFFFSFFFFFTVNSVSRIGCIEKGTSPKTCFFKDIFGISSVYEWECTIQQTFPCNCRNEKILAKGKWKIAAPVEKNLRKWFLRRKWANEEKRGDEYVEVLWKRGSVYGGDRFGVEDCMDCRISSSLPFIFLPPAFNISHTTSFLTDVFCKLASFLLLWCQKE